MLQQRIHPAASRVDGSAAETPASFVAFDLLALGDEDLTARPFTERRARARAGARRAREPPIHLTSATDDRDVARGWFEPFEGAGLDGVVAKPLDVAYQPDVRADAQDQARAHGRLRRRRLPVHKAGPTSMGSLLLGLYGDDGQAPARRGHRRPSR